MSNVFDILLSDGGDSQSGARENQQGIKLISDIDDGIGIIKF